MNPLDFHKVLNPKMEELDTMKSVFAIALTLAAIVVSLLFGKAGMAQEAQITHVTIQNQKVKVGVLVHKGVLSGDCIRVLPEWAARFHTKPVAIKTDADFALNVMWTGWRAPGKINNGNNPVVFTKKDFQFLEQKETKQPNGTQTIDLFFKGKNNPFQLRMSYSLKPGAFFVRRRIAVRDTFEQGHFLRKICARKGQIFGDLRLVKSGGFGQPAAFTLEEGSGFFGLEYPTSQNKIQKAGKKSANLTCSVVMGKKIGRNWLETDAVVTGVAPNPYVKWWFIRYLDDIRVAPVRPFILYNTWYDLRAPEMVRDSSHVMNAANIKRIIRLFKQNMVDRYGIHLNAFVLDDGWDVYRSNWVLRKKQFPNGLKPISDELEKIGTHLGLWFGPIGGYSHRSWRVAWMKKHGYETVGDEMCLAGKNYSQLFKKRVVDFVEKDGVRFYKWDGIQFSCSEPDHGHEIGIYSQKAVMDTVAMLCQAVRKNHRDVYLNITSGTWLSPWWLKWANQIWMQSGDYGFSSVPSISRRDAAITYRDLSLYNDFHRDNLWFPISNMMTHGIIKGNLQELGKRPEPLSKFTDNALLYFARGVSMWELYISPDLLDDAQWGALSKSIKWAKDRFPILRHTEMVGGNPGQKEAYGYVHFSGNRGIIAARNPFVKSQKLTVTLAPSFGINPEAASLVLERVYPNHWVSPEIYSAGAQIEIPLKGYETAVYEVYPLRTARLPLLGGASYDVVKDSCKFVELSVYAAQNDVHWLNPEKLAAVKIAEQPVKLNSAPLGKKSLPGLVSQPDFAIHVNRGRTILKSQFKLNGKAAEATLAILLEANQKSTGAKIPSLDAKINGKRVSPEKEQVKGKWLWAKYPISPGENRAKFTFRLKKGTPAWSGNVSAWVIGLVRPKAQKVHVEMLESTGKEHPMPPRPRPAGEFQTSVQLGQKSIQLK